MKIAIVNLVARTVLVDNPTNILSAFSLPRPRIETDEDSNIVQLGLELTRLGNEVTIYASDAFLPARSIGNSQKGLSTRYLPTRLTRLFPYAYYPFTPTLHRELLDNEYDIVQSGEFFQLGTIISAFASSKGNFPCIVWHELGVQQNFPANLIEESYCRTLGKLIEKKVRFFIPRSYAARDWLVGKGVPEPKIGCVLHSGANMRMFYPMKNTPQLKTRFGVPEDSVLIASVARLHPYRRLDHVIMALRLLANRCSQVYLIIAGDGPQADYLNDLIAKINLQKHVRLVGRLSKRRLNELYNACDFTVLAGKKGLFPSFSIAESLTCGKPVIHSSPGGERDLGGDGFASFYVKYGDIRALAEKMLLLIENPEICNRMGKNALELARKEYILETVARKFLNAYRACIEEPFKS